MEKLVLVSSNKIFGGQQNVYSHESSELGCKMNFSVYLPPQAEEGGDVRLPVIFYLSGLTCTEQNFITKSGFQRYAAEHGIIVVGPDTSPRGVKVPGDDESWDFGVSAGFYLDASKKPWSDNYRMGSYINKELYELVQQAFSNVDPQRIGIMGHSMGGHGALISTLRNPGLYKSASAFAPICNPSACPWGQKAFSGYIGSEKSKWAEWDATELVQKYDGPPLTLFIDQGAADKFYIEKQLLPENLVEACRSVGVPIIFNLREGYDHSYYYISTYIGEHFNFHAKILKA